MHSERWQQVNDIFHAALASEPARRDAFVAEACGSDASLRAEVEALLAAHDEAGSFGETPLFVPALSLESGSSFGPYRIAELLGAGGMGEVYRARDDALERDVAIKVLPRHFASDPGPVARLGREARLLAALSDRHIGAIFGVVEAGALRGLVLEFVEGPTLADRLAAGPLSVDEALRIAHQIAEAIEAAHEKGVTHRDLKPANIKITPEGTVKVLDFGLAKAMRDDSSASPTAGPAVDRTMEGTLVGTAAYMSPEQARGQRVDRRTDIWAFGCVLYEMLTGRQAFDAETVADTLLKVLEHEPDWELLPATVPEPIRKLLRRCLSKDLAARLHDIGDARLDIAETMEVRPGQRLHSPPPNVREGSWWSPGIMLAAIGAAAVVVAGALTIPARLVDRSGPVWRNPFENAQVTRFTDFPGSEWDAAISPDGNFVAFLSDRDGPADVLLSQVGTGRFPNLTQGKEQNLEEGSVRRVGFSGDGSEIWVHAPEGPVRLMPLMGGQPRIFLTERAANVAWSPDRARLVYHTRDDGDAIFVADSTGANVRQIFVSPRGVHNHYPAWSPDGKWIYFVRGLPIVSEMDVWRIPASGGAAERLTEHNSDVAYPAAVDQRTIVYVSHDRDGSGPWLWALDVERKVTHRVSFGLEKYRSIAASADGHRLVATVEDPAANLWSVPILERPAEERDVERFPVPSVRALMPRFAGPTLFYVSSRGGGDGLWRFHDGETEEVWKGSDGALLEPAAVSPDGRRVAFVLRRNGRLRMQVETANGTEPRMVAENLEIQGTGCWSPDAKWIVIGGSDANGPGLFKIPADGGDAPVRIANGLASNPVWSPDGSLIAYAGPNVALYAPLVAVRPNGTPVDMPAIKVDRDGERIRFLPDSKGLVYMQGKGASEDFWLLDLATLKSRRLTRLNNPATVRTFDITPDGKQIVFDRLRHNSDIVLIDLR